MPTLTVEELRDIVGQVQRILYEDTDTAGQPFLNPDKQWGSETTEYLGGVLEDYGLRPDDRNSVREQS